MKVWEIAGTIMFIAVIVMIVISAAASMKDVSDAKKLCEKDGHTYERTEHLGGMFETGRYNAICRNEICDGDYCTINYYMVKAGGK